MPIRPIILHGHTRPLTCVKFNRDSDLLFTCARDHTPNVWYAENGERLGTFNGHQGSVFHCDISYHTEYLLTASADRTAKLWDIQTGKELNTWDHASGVRNVGFATGERMFLTVQDNTFSKLPRINLFNLDVNNLDKTDRDPETKIAIPLRSMYVKDSTDKMNSAFWGPLNSTIISGGDDGYIRLWDVEAGVEIQSVHAHSKAIQSISYSADQTMFITASSDQTSRLYDTKTFELLKTFTSDRPLNAAAISPTHPHVIVGGGQEASAVTITSAKVGHFETDFYHIVYGDFLGSVKGHFGPVNTIAFNANGKGYASGAEDGYIRLYHFDKEYFTNKHNV